MVVGESVVTPCPGARRTVEQSHPMKAKSTYIHSLELTWKWRMAPSSEDHEIHYKQVVPST